MCRNTPAERGFLNAHETAHYSQQIGNGFGSFYYKTISDYMKFGFKNTYGIKGTYEYAADQYAINKLGYFNYRGFKK